MNDRMAAVLIEKEQDANLIRVDLNKTPTLKRKNRIMMAKSQLKFSKKPQRVDESKKTKIVAPVSTTKYRFDRKFERANMAGVTTPWQAYHPPHDLFLSYISEYQAADPL